MAALLKTDADGLNAFARNATTIHPTEALWRLREDGHPATDQRRRLQ
jgi:hypothetical protein